MEARNHLSWLSTAGHTFPQIPAATACFVGDTEVNHEMDGSSSMLSAQSSVWCRVPGQLALHVRAGQCGWTPSWSNRGDLMASPSTISSTGRPGHPLLPNRSAQSKCPIHLVHQMGLHTQASCSFPILEGWLIATGDDRTGKPGCV